MTVTAHIALGWLLQIFFSSADLAISVWDLRMRLDSFLIARPHEKQKICQFAQCLQWYFLISLTPGMLLMWSVLIW